jgi:TolB-like protein/Flp pilus assembly protein TadD
MPSIVQGYEYDIFISYRQNDNRSGWVTEFVAALQEELAATIKDSVSVYFDTNPNDGLLETHLIDKSVENKLKCLIFIPVISQTYCDPKSFAWQNEFIAFNKAAGNDSIGGSIKLSNGNVSGRMLPVKIHDLDIADKSLLEFELGGPIRSVEFIFRSPGVNRPLKPGDSRTENLNHTYYRDQINKVANAVKEIITALKDPVNQNARNTKDGQLTKKPKRNTRTSLVIFSFLLVLSVAAYFLYPKLLSSEKAEVEIDKSIAVLPFVNLSNDPEQDYFSNGVMEEILTHLFKIGDLRVTSRTSVMGYKGTTKKVTEIAKELKVAHILEGSVQKDGEKVRITVQLIDAVNDRHIWAEHYDRELKDVFTIQSEVAIQIASSLKTSLSPELKERIESSPTNSTEAYDLYLKGREQIGTYYSKFELSYIYKGIDFLDRAIALDSNYSKAYTGLAYAHWVLAQFSPDYSARTWETSKKYSMKAIELDPSDGLAYAELAEVQYKWDWDSMAARASFQKALQLAPGDINIHDNAMWFYQRINDCENLEKERRILISMGDPDEAGDYFFPLCKNDLNQILELNADDYWFYKAPILLHQKKYQECIEYLKEELTISPYNIIYRTILGEAYALAGDLKMADQTIKELKGLSDKRYVSKCEIATIYLAMGDKDKAFQLLDQALKEHDPYLHVLKEFFVSMYRINDDPRFVSIMERSWIPRK